MTDTTSGANIPRHRKAVREGPCPLCGRKRHDRRYRRRGSARREALLRDAEDSESGLSPRARAFIMKSRGRRVPYGYEVSHEKPLYTKARAERCTLDESWNMKTQQKSVHRERHKQCGDQFHGFKRDDYQHLS